MSETPNCPRCQSSYTYQDGALYICPECSHEWSADDDATSTDGADGPTAADANGNTLQDGDSVIVVKDLKVKGAAGALKVGTKVKNIRIVQGDHNIDCKIPGFGAMALKSEFVKKA